MTTPQVLTLLAVLSFVVGALSAVILSEILGVFFFAVGGVLVLAMIIVRISNSFQK